MKSKNRNKFIQTVLSLRTLFLVTVALSISVYYGEIKHNYGLNFWGFFSRGYLFLRKILPIYLQNTLEFYEEILSFSTTLVVLLIGFYLPWRGAIWRRTVTLSLVAILGLIAYIQFQDIEELFFSSYFESFKNVKIFLWLYGQGILGLFVFPPSACTFAVWLWKNYGNKDCISLSIVLRIMGYYLSWFGVTYVLLMLISPNKERAYKIIYDSWTIKVTIASGILSFLLSIILQSRKQKIPIS